MPSNITIPRSADSERSAWLNKMIKRIITAIVALLVFVPIVIYSETVIFNIFIALCSLAGVYEMLSCIGLKKKYYISLPSYLLAAVLPFVTDGGLEGAFTAFAVYLFFLLFVSVFLNSSLEEITRAFTLVFYVVISFLCMLALRRQEGGEHLFYLIFIGAWVTDTFAYFCGFLFGKHKLIPKISPKKTVEGAVGAVIFCVIAFLVYAFVLNKMSICANYLAFGITGLVVSPISQLGDLAASLIKRRFDIKDYGNIFPGHGGILDRFDSVIAVSMLMFVLSKIEFFTLV